MTLADYALTIRFTFASRLPHSRSATKSCTDTHSRPPVTQRRMELRRVPSREQCLHSKVGSHALTMLSRFLTSQRQRAVPSHGRSSDRPGKLAIPLVITVDAAPGGASIITTRRLRSKCDRAGGPLDVCPRLTPWQTLLAVCEHSWPSSGTPAAPVRPLDHHAARRARVLHPRFRSVSHVRQASSRGRDSTGCGTEDVHPCPTAEKMSVKGEFARLALLACRCRPLEGRSGYRGPSRRLPMRLECLPRGSRLFTNSAATASEAPDLASVRSPEYSSYRPRTPSCPNEAPTRPISRPSNRPYSAGRRSMGSAPNTKASTCPTPPAVHLGLRLFSHESPSILAAAGLISGDTSESPEVLSAPSSTQTTLPPFLCGVWSVPCVSGVVQLAEINGYRCPAPDFARLLVRLRRAPIDNFLHREDPRPSRFGSTTSRHCSRSKL